jgi:nitroimidazol reductase NimA-like FMN-containing flavoprotein (pyridoxamine 5'-phosphate oxidase superfamily)
MVGELTQEECWALLRENRIGRLGCHADGMTYIVPLGYALDGHRLVFQTTLGLKIEMMEKNPEVCFQTDQGTGASDWRSVIVWGRYMDLPEGEKPGAARLLIDRLSAAVKEEGRSPRDVTPDKVGGRYEGVVFALSIDRVTGRFEKPE